MPLEESSSSSSSSPVSTLLTSCSNSSAEPYSVRYKGKLYSSASEALDAYLEDFDLALPAQGSTGKVCIHPGIPKAGSIPKRRAQEHRDMALGRKVLDDFYQPLGLDSLTPSSGSPRECEPDSISLATDELLALPADGSQPFLPPIPLNPRIPRRESLKSSSCPSQTSGLPLGRGFNPHRNPPKALSKKKHTGRAGPLEEDSKAFPWGNYPRWLNQSDLSVSGISSIPSSPYPAWLKTYNLFSDPAPSPAPGPTSQREASSSPLLKPGPSDPDNSQFSNPSGSLEPGGDEREGRCHPATPHGCFSLETSSWAHTKQLWREPQLLPVPTTERPSEDGARTEKDGSPATTEILQAGRPWPEAPGALKPSTCREDLEPPLALPKVDLLPKSLEDRWSGQEKEAAFSGGHQPRPLEALKLLLFQLQAIQGSLSQWATTEQKEEGGKLPGGGESDSQLCGPERTLLANSIQTALEHCLQRLEAKGGHQEGFFSCRR